MYCQTYYLIKPIPFLNSNISTVLLTMANFLKKHAVPAYQVPWTCSQKSQFEITKSKGIRTPLNFLTSILTRSPQIIICYIIKLFFFFRLKEIKNTVSKTSSFNFMQIMLELLQSLHFPNRLTRR